ncbi:TPA: GDP-fucose synthetase [Candidatus Nomurabacteria bacterium]|nr:MAG: NAD-dependent epimerase/dehydratase [Candidatus Nomurabacteria bacterium GW2011_GWE2_36_115]KKP93347.1 MAG: NAD-dependent epimerase/dehydratase [Candidatus Nomurabacteria bacterium GW2011_GWF2_36_126]KKP96387.1 MAG: NAD-dependent epimerase/dehydratase [Candidatus Nomurabacteria bacterium GW2011_GWD2_36_14]KKP99129.1 MAG: NAD-dependent epimerase/dehydratase [Candidatus Nomurabacteria bacterium GW2011_GWF2_36_19]KKQ05030.1 MAG: NAD-dependent epimerase/dehydratase [Candidatus Nomurabacteri
MNKNSKIYIAGHNGLVGSAIVRALKEAGYSNLLTKPRSDLDLTSYVEVEKFFTSEKPEYIFLAAAKVGGIFANDKYPADFIKDNILIQTNIIDNAYKSKAKKLLFLGSSCIYPKLALQPIREEYFMTGALEPTNEPYAIAKIAGIIMCQSYSKQYGMDAISVMPTNLYGENDNFDLESSHVLPAMIRKFDDAKKNNLKEVVLWGTGSPKREFLHVDDLASACVFLMNNYSSPKIINIGTGEDLSILELANIVKECVGYKGQIVWDSSKPDGTPRKLLDISKIKSLGWSPKIRLTDGIKRTYKWYKENVSL